MSPDCCASNGGGAVSAPSKPARQARRDSETVPSNRRAALTATAGRSASRRIQTHISEVGGRYCAESAWSASATPPGGRAARCAPPPERSPASLNGVMAAADAAPGRRTDRLAPRSGRAVAPPLGHDLPSACKKIPKPIDRTGRTLDRVPNTRPLLIPGGAQARRSPSTCFRPGVLSGTAPTPGSDRRLLAAVPGDRGCGEVRGRFSKHALSPPAAVPGSARLALPNQATAVPRAQGPGQRASISSVSLPERCHAIGQ